MIDAHQPTIFGNQLIVGLSSVDNGNMRFARGDDAETRQNRINFLTQVGIDPIEATLLQVTYENVTDFTRYQVIDDDSQGEGMLEPVSSIEADALVVTRPDHAIFLPLADCVGAIVYDPVAEILMVSHLGRHSVEAQGAFKSVRYLQQQFGSVPTDLQIWLSPAVGSDSYPLQAFDNHSLQEVVIEQLLRAGVAFDQIEASSVDTAEDDNYFSHSQHLAGTQLSDGRFAIVAMMPE
ncbi:MAG TPA: laccase domain-containing protein [Candidatus Saccharimonadales bacterium]|nr:laccase domain-containing protein [Candidatus Saccharimonadales bacterium]